MLLAEIQPTATLIGRGDAAETLWDLLNTVEIHSQPQPWGLSDAFCCLKLHKPFVITSSFQSNTQSICLPALQRTFSDSDYTTATRRQRNIPDLRILRGVAVTLA